MIMIDMLDYSGSGLVEFVPGPAFNERNFDALLILVPSKLKSDISVLKFLDITMQKPTNINEASALIMYQNAIDVYEDLLPGGTGYILPFPAKSKNGIPVLTGIARDVHYDYRTQTKVKGVFEAITNPFYRILLDIEPVNNLTFDKPKISIAVFLCEGVTCLDVEDAIRQTCLTENGLKKWNVEFSLFSMLPKKEE